MKCVVICLIMNLAFYINALHHGKMLPGNIKKAGIVASH